MVPPCENCITLGLCKAQMRGDIASLLILTRKCALIGRFLHSSINKTESGAFTLRSVGEFTNAIKVLEKSLLKGVGLLEKIDLYKMRIKNR